MADELTTVAEESVRGGFFLFSGTAIATLILAISSIIIARLIGPELYGQYTLAFVTPSLLFIFADLGIDQGILKFTAEHRSRNDEKSVAKMIKHGLIIRASLGLTLFIISYVLAEQFATLLLQRPELAFYVRIASIAILFQTVFTTAISAFVGIDKAEYNAITNNIQAAAKTIISILLVLSGFAVTGAILGHVVSYFVGAVTGIALLIIILRKQQTKTTDQSFKHNAKVLIAYGAPLYVFALLAGFIPFIQNILLAYFTTDGAIGNYRAAANFAVLLTVIAFPITTALLPAFSKLSPAPDKQAKNFFKLANKYTAILVIPATILIIAYSSQIVQIIYGLTFTSAPLYLAMYCLLYLLVGIGYLTLGSFFNGFGKTRITLKMGLVTFTTLLVLSVPLTMFYGVEGLIAAFLLSNAAGTLFGSFIARKQFNVEFATPSLVRIYAISGLAMIIPLLIEMFLPINNLLQLIIGLSIFLFTYITLIPFTKVVTAYEIKQVGDVLKKIRLLAPLSTIIIRYLQLLKAKSDSKE